MANRFQRTLWRRLCFYATFVWRFVVLRRPEPLIYGIALTDRCNLACRGCHVSNTGRRDMTWDQLVAAMQNAWARGFRELYFSGGEPTLWRAADYTLADAIVEAKRIGFFHVHVYTNGLLGLETSADLVWVSMDGLPGIFDRRRGDHFHQVERAVRAGSPPKVAIIYVIDRNTAEGIEPFLRWVRETKFPVIGVMFYFHTPYYGRDELFLTTEERAPIIDRLLGCIRAGLPVINSVEPYTKAAIAEVDWWADAIGPAEITSVYVGGGTPTLALDSVASVLMHVRERFRLTGDICIETNPADVDDETVERLHDMGVALVSLGVESFQPVNLAMIGRDYKPVVAERALALLAESGFASINVDLMFALPGQTVGDVTADLARAAQLSANQLTTYPIFTFPYTSVGEYLRLTAVRMPKLHVRRAHYRAISAWCAEHGFARVSVWGFKQGGVPRYSSVTRDGYIGIGPGAGSHLPDGFVLNTFDLDSWEQAVRERRAAIALRMPFTPKMSSWWWLYWRFYDTRISLDDLDAVLGNDAPKARWWLRAIEQAGLTIRNGGYLELTEPGAFWLHLAQNHFALNYVNTLWTRARQEPWPQTVAI